MLPRVPNWRRAGCLEGCPKGTSKTTGKKHKGSVRALDRPCAPWKPPAAPNYPLRHPKYRLIETIRPLIEVHWGGLGRKLEYDSPNVVAAWAPSASAHAVSALAGLAEHGWLRGRQTGGWLSKLWSLFGLHTKWDIDVDIDTDS